MTDKPKKIISLKRDVRGLMVPSAAPIMLYKDTEVTITQSLGHSYTISVYGNLVRIDAKDADALGKKVRSPLTDLPKSATLKDKVWSLLKTVYDPEIPVNIVDLGLVYECAIERHQDGTQIVLVEMTLTSPGCGMGPVLAEDAKTKLLAIPEIDEVDVKIVFDPPWDREMMSDEAKLQLGVL